MLDPHYNNVSLLLPMIGINNGIVFNDYSARPKTITRYNAVTTSSQSKYYGSSGFFDGSVDYLTANAHVDFDMGGENFSVGCWYKLLANPGENGRALACCGSSTSNRPWGLNINGSNGLSFWVRTNTNYYSADSTDGFGFNTDWNHAMGVRYENNLLLFVNGFLRASAVMSGIAQSGQIVVIGRVPWNASADMYGYLNDVQVTKGIAREITNFTPPPRLLPSVSGIIRDITGVPCARKVCIYNRDNGALLGSQTSDGVSGQYEILTHPANEEISRVVFADETSLYNDLIDRVRPG